MAAVLHVMVLICYLVLVLIALGATVPYKQQLNLNPTMSQSCIAPNNKTGTCVDNSICNEAHTIEPGGIIDESDYRSKKQCPEQFEWCCTSEIIPPPEIGSSNSDKCFAPETDVCPWCVLLYNTVEKQTAVRPFCLGALIGSRVIITASTCLKTARKKLLYAQVPNSANPGNNYTIIRRQYHPSYNSGSHEYDFGITVIDGDVTFDKEKARGACVNFEDPFEGDCVGYGFDINGKIASTILNVKKNSCAKNGSAKDAACGINADRVCIIAPGGPLLCPNKNNHLFLFGIARGICDSNDNVMLGGISHSKTWIEKELSSMKISKDVYSLGDEDTKFTYKHKKEGYG